MVGQQQARGDHKAGPVAGVQARSGTDADAPGEAGNRQGQLEEAHPHEVCLPQHAFHADRLHQGRQNPPGKRRVVDHPQGAGAAGCGAGQALQAQPDPFRRLRLHHISGLDAGPVLLPGLLALPPAPRGFQSDLNCLHLVPSCPAHSGRQMDNPFTARLYAASRILQILQSRQFNALSERFSGRAFPPCRNKYPVQAQGRRTPACLYHIRSACFRRARSAGAAVKTGSCASLDGW